MLWEDDVLVTQVVDTKVTPMDPKPLELRDYLSIMWARKWTIAAIAATTTAVALAYSFRQTPVYTSSAEVLVLSVSLDPTVSSAASIPPNMLKEQQVANSAAVKRRASLHLAQLGITKGTMSATQVEGAETLVFSSVGTRPQSGADDRPGLHGGVSGISPKRSRRGVGRGA